MYICPICNGLVNYDINCKICGARLQIMNRLEDYDDSYSPYLSYNITDMNDGDPAEICSHVCVCTACSSDGVVRVRMQMF